MIKSRNLHIFLCIIAMTIAMVVSFISFCQMIKMNNFGISNNDNRTYLVQFFYEDEKGNEHYVEDIPITKFLKGTPHITETFIVNSASNNKAWKYNTFVRLDDSINKDLVEDIIVRKINILCEFSPTATVLYKELFFYLKPFKDIKMEDKAIMAKQKQVSIGMFTFSVGLLVVALVMLFSVTMAEVPLEMKRINTLRVLGVSKWSIRFRIICKNLSITGISLLITLFIILLLDHSGLFGKSIMRELNLSNTSNALIFGGITLYAIISGLITGIIPAFYATHFSIPTILKGRFAHSRRGKFLRKTALSIQFILSLISIQYCVVINELNNSLLEERFNNDYGKHSAFTSNRILISKGLWLSADDDCKRCEAEFKKLGGIEEVVFYPRQVEVYLKEGVDVDIKKKQLFQKQLQLSGCKNLYANETEAEMRYGFKTYQETLNDTYLLEIQYAHQLYPIAIACLIITLLGFYQVINIDSKYLQRSTAIKRVLGMTKTEATHDLTEYYFSHLWLCFLAAAIPAGLLQHSWASTFGLNLYPLNNIPIWIVLIAMHLFIYLLIRFHDNSPINKNITKALKTE